jgi:hypothetical protein
MEAKNLLEIAKGKGRYSHESHDTMTSTRCGSYDAVTRPQITTFRDGNVKIQ